MQKEFKIATFNLFNLALPKVKYYNRMYQPDDYRKKINWIGHQLDHMGADIIGFQEVFHEKALQEAIDASNLGKMHIVVAPSAEDGPKPGPSVAIASKFPILDYEVLTKFHEPLTIGGIEVPVTHFSRPVLKARIQITKDLITTVLVVHLKSKRPLLENQEDGNNPLDRANGQARSLIKRASETIGLRHYLLKELYGNDRPVILLGDTNDTNRSVTTQILSGDPPPQYWNIKEKKKSWDVLLYHVKDIQSRRGFHDFYYTHIHNGHYESLDHIMVSQEFVSENPNRIGRVGNITTLTDHLVNELYDKEGLPCWKSDHGLVIATIQLDRLNQKEKEKKVPKKE